MYTYAYLRGFDDQTTKTTTSTDQAVVLRYLRQVTKRIEGMTHRVFVPETKTHIIGYAEIVTRRMARMLELNQHVILSVTSITAAGNTVSSSNYRLFPYSVSPASMIEAINNSTWLDSLNDTDDQISIAGVFGYRTNYSRDGWLNSLDTVQDGSGINTTATTITVTDADGADYNGETPRFTPGQVIRVDDEFMIVSATNTSTNVLTVLRGALGSTAATHDNGTQIDVWTVEPEIARAAQLIAAYNFDNRGKFTRTSFDGQFLTSGIEIPDEATAILARYQHVFFGNTAG